MKIVKQFTLYRFSFLFLVLAMLSCSEGGQEESAYASWDADESGELDEEEVYSVWSTTKYYDEWDTNRDAFIDEHEWNNARQRYLGTYEGIFGDWDPDADGRLAEEEFRSRVFEFYDADKSGTINAEEYDTWFGDLRDL